MNIYRLAGAMRGPCMCAHTNTHIHSEEEQPSGDAAESLTSCCSPLPHSSFFPLLYFPSLPSAAPPTSMPHTLTLIDGHIGPEYRGLCVYFRHARLSSFLPAPVHFCVPRGSIASGAVSGVLENPSSVCLCVLCVSVKMRFCVYSMQADASFDQCLFPSAAALLLALSL